MRRRRRRLGRAPAAHGRRSAARGRRRPALAAKPASPLFLRSLARLGIADLMMLIFSAKPFVRTRLARWPASGRTGKEESFIGGARGQRKDKRRKEERKSSPLFLLSLSAELGLVEATSLNLTGWREQSRLAERQYKGLKIVVSPERRTKANADQSPSASIRPRR